MVLKSPVTLVGAVCMRPSSEILFITPRIWPFRLGRGTRSPSTRAAAKLSRLRRLLVVIHAMPPSHPLTFGGWNSSWPSRSSMTKLIGCVGRGA